MKYLVDTDWIINYLKGHEKTVDVLSSLYDDGFSVSIISFAEVYEGIYYHEGKKRETLEEQFKNFLDGILVIDVDGEVGKKFAEIRVKLRRQGNLIDNFDLLIAATAVRYDLNLLSNNINHFERVPGLTLKTIKNF